jgi:DNA-binding PadR family transcriptional regulator
MEWDSIVALQPTDAGAELPLTEASFLILLSLAERPMHGYLIMQTINTVFRTGFKMGPGTLYRTLQLQTRSGLIKEVESDDAEVDDSRRRYYAITPRGRAVARQELDRLRTLYALAKVRIGHSHADA